MCSLALFTYTYPNEQLDFCLLILPNSPEDYYLIGDARDPNCHIPGNTKDA